MLVAESRVRARARSPHCLAAISKETSGVKVAASYPDSTDARPGWSAIAYRNGTKPSGVTRMGVQNTQTLIKLENIVATLKTPHRISSWPEAGQRISMLAG